MYFQDKKETFQSPYEDCGGIPCSERNGQSFEILYEIEGDPNIYPEVLPMYKIKFKDGVEIEAWPEEIFNME
jgi:hypothetical protein